jgi:hypothetical protein
VAWIYSGIVENMRKTPIFVLADSMAVFEALIVALAPHRIFADEAAMPVKDGMAPGRTERMVLVVDRSRELGAAVCVTAIMPRGMFTHLRSLR